MLMQSAHRLEISHQKRALRHHLIVLAALLIAMFSTSVHADDDSAPVSSTITNGVRYPAIAGGSSAWFDFSQICRVISVASGSPSIPVFIPGSQQQWTSWLAAISNGSYQGRVGVQACCRPNSAISLSRCGGAEGSVTQYGHLGDTATTNVACPSGQTDKVTYTCATDSSANGASWQDTTECLSNASIGSCSVTCGGGTQAVYDSCGNQTGTQTCNTQTCCTANASVGACSASCGSGTQAVYDSCGNQTGTQNCSDYSGCGYAWLISWGSCTACTPNASVGSCSVTCGGGTQAVYDSCGNQTGTQSCNTQACAAPINGQCGCDPTWNCLPGGSWCAAGTAANFNLQACGGTAGNWDCVGSNGGTTANCHYMEEHCGQ
ncbi:hypothetical protein [Telmatospirillum siberiense]|uniref:SRCR domain-containing protein n=1 Tax=Telmatospirillum siberiense TaxID=382514 RepID=A0A2N3PLV6_9PROT|nr:hypothetical protein [Telmatospirillum siberiense]PKU21388.1 hypothetical protein CWS72_26955 [Telmatospirillum siberiense]